MFEISKNGSDSLLSALGVSSFFLPSRQQIVDFDISTARLSVVLQPP